MSTAYTVTGVLSDDNTVTLDESVPVKPGKVQVVVKPVSETKRRPAAEVLAEIRARQAARGFVPSSKEEVDEYLNAERDSWERDRDRE